MPAIVNRKFQSFFEHNDDGTLKKYNATRCAHNHEIIVQQPGHEQGINWDFCMRCMAPICLKCARKMAVTGECEAYEKALLKMERLRGIFPPGTKEIDRDIARILNTRGDGHEPVG